MDLTKYLLEECKRHPSLAPQDVVKLCFQAAFGAEHMLGDIGKAREYFQKEYEATPVDDRPLAEYISPTVCRVNLAAWKRLQLNPDWLWNMFVYSLASQEYRNNSDVFESYLVQADKLCKTEEFPFVYARWREYIDAYKDAWDNISEQRTFTLRLRPASVRHSSVYREAEKPAYRIISGRNAILLPIFKAMAGLEKGVIAIDGRAAAGKSTLAGSLYDITNAGVIRMDDFFLPPKLRTAERFAQPGGNVHYERFIEEVLPNLKSGQGFTYHKFDCSRMEYSDTPVEVHPHPWRIVEGVYSHHPILGDYMDIRVFVDIRPEEQQIRINNRNTPEIAARYLNDWVPMEEAYFKAYNTREAADVVID